MVIGHPGDGSDLQVAFQHPHLISSIIAMICNAMHCHKKLVPHRYRNNRKIPGSSSLQALPQAALAFATAHATHAPKIYFIIIIFVIIIIITIIILVINFVIIIIITRPRPAGPRWTVRRVQFL